MKIDNSVKGVGTSRLQESKAKKSPASAERKDSSSVDDNVDLTSTASQLQMLESTLANTGVMDMEKVESVRQAIAEGRFQVDAEAVAERLLENVVEGLKRQRKA